MEIDAIHCNPMEFEWNSMQSNAIPRSVSRRGSSQRFNTIQCNSRHPVISKNTMQFTAIQFNPMQSDAIRYSRELETLALILDYLMGGRLAALGDVAMQRFKAVQTSVREGNWQTARHQELIEDDNLLTTDREQDMSVRAELRAQKLRSQLDSVRRTETARPDG
jgi:hypothetical protein